MSLVARSFHQQLDVKSGKLLRLVPSDVVLVLCRFCIGSLLIIRPNHRQGPGTEDAIHLKVLQFWLFVDASKVACCVCGRAAFGTGAARGARPESRGEALEDGV